MSKQEFITAFIVSYLASDAANQSQKIDCFSDDPYFGIKNNPPAKLALEIAEAMWKNYEVQKALTKHLK